jgi:hypothetical protein
MADEADSSWDSLQSDEPRPNWGRRFVIGGIVIAALILAYAFAVSVIPRWWAQRVGSVVDGSMTVGSLAGLVSGFVFTLLPLLMLWAGFKFRAGWKRWLLVLAGALLLATPNLFLLGIVLGNGNASHAGERILDVEGPGFRGASVIGAILAALAFVAIVYLASSRRASRKKADKLRDELRERDQPHEERA